MDILGLRGLGKIRIVLTAGNQGEKNCKVSGSQVELMWSIFDDPVGGSTGPLTPVYSHFTSVMVSPVPMAYWLDTSTSALPSSLLRAARFPPCTQGEASVLYSTSSSYHHTARPLLSPLVGPLFHSTAVLLL